MFVLYQSRNRLQDGEYKLSPGVLKELNKESFSDAKSYVVNIIGTHIIIGEDYVNGSGGTGNTHPRLRADTQAYLTSVGILDNLAVHDALGGALRVNADGSVDVSGYHKSSNSVEAARIIAYAVKVASPETTVRWTSGRLSEGALQDFIP